MLYLLLDAHTIKPEPVLNCTISSLPEFSDQPDFFNMIDYTKREVVIWRNSMSGKKRIYIARHVYDSPALPRDDVIHSMIRFNQEHRHDQDSPRISFFTGEIHRDGTPVICLGKPTNIKTGKQSAWVVDHNGTQMILVDPRYSPTQGREILNITPNLMVQERIVVQSFEIPAEPVVINGFEIRNSPEGLVDCKSSSGAVMNTFDTIHDAIVWALSEDAPKLDADAKKELDRLDEEYDAGP